MPLSPTAPLLLSNGNPAVSNEPFFHVQIDDFLPWEHYHSLLDQFPKAAAFPETIEGNKKRLNSRSAPAAFQEYCLNHPVWTRLFEQFSSDQFLDELYELVRKPLREARGFLGARPWRHDTQAVTGLKRLLRRRAVVTFEFSRLESGSLVPPHTDAPEKLVTLMLYFADPGWQADYGGGTVFYRPKRPDLKRNWTNYRVPFEDLSAVSVNEFRPNHLCLFIKSKDSYHGMPSITCPAGVARNSLNINVFLKPKRFRRIIKFKNELTQRLEHYRQHSERAAQSFSYPDILEGE
jgi:hypothetical protein